MRSRLNVLHTRPPLVRRPDWADNALTLGVAFMLLVSFWVWVAVIIWAWIAGSEPVPFGHPN